MNKTLAIKNGTIVTMNQKREIFDGSLLVENGKIVDIYRGKDAPRADTEIDARGSIVTPGFICAHTHLYGILLRGATLNITPPTDFTQNLQRIWWLMDEEMNYQDAYISALTASLELLRSGTTTFADTFSGPNAIKGVLDFIDKGVNEVGIRGILSFEATQRRNLDEGYKGLQENVRYIKSLTNGKMRGMISVHASFTVTDDLLKEAESSATELNVPLTIHASEGRWDLYHNLERYGKRTFERLNDLRLLNKRAVVAHAVNVNEDEMGIIQKTRTNIVHNPLSNMLNAVGVAPVPELKRLGVNISLGNDGYIFDTFENMRAAFLLHKVNKLDPRVMSFLDVIEMSTINAAKSYGIDGELGSLETGKAADIVIIKPFVRPTPLVPSSSYAYLINGANGKDVDTVIINGEIVLSKGVPTRVEMEKVNEKANETVKNYWGRLAKAKERIEVLKL